MTVHAGSEIIGIEEYEVDVVVVGSGGGGAPAAHELARAGLDVVVLEAGPKVTPEELSQRPLDTVRRVYVDKGGQETADGGVQILQGSCVGGSTVVNGEVCFRIPDAVLCEWRDTFGVSGLAPETLAPVFAEVEERIHANDGGGRHLDASALTLGGLTKLGLDPKPVMRSVKGCRGCNYCFFGCSYGCKQSMDQSYLPLAMGEGATVVSDARVERLERSGSRVTGVVARTPHGTLSVRARAVVLACGAIATPLMLQDHGLGGPQAGENLALHPIIGAFAFYPGEQPARSGAMIGAYSDAHVKDGYLIETVNASRDFLASFLPGFGRPHRELVRRLDHLGLSAAIVRDTGGLGRVSRDRKGNKRITWSLDARTEQKVRAGFRTCVDAHFAGGAEEVVMPTLAPRTLRPDDDLTTLDAVPLGPADVQFLSYHPQGTARIGAVTDDEARVVDTDNLYVMDTSLFPSPVGVNTQVAVMAVSTLMARRLADRMS